MRHVAKLICLVVAGLVGWKAYIYMDGVFDPRWITYGITAAISLLVWVLLYFPLLRPISDVISDRLAATAQRFKSHQSGVGLDDIPSEVREITQTVSTVCGICKNPSRDPVCARCHEKMSK